MLRIPNGSSQAMVEPGRIVPLDRARTFITLSVLLHHSVLNYTWFGQGDPMRWLGFDLVVLFNDSYFMAFMFFISGLFVRDSLMRKGPALFLRFAIADWRMLDALRPSAYGVYLLHYIFIIWLQYAVYDDPLPAGVKFAIVFAGTLSLSWGLTAALRKIPVVARMI
jgi:surface polysaccharide O-acyltransferase-like enzyme